MEWFCDEKTKRKTLSQHKSKLLEIAMLESLRLFGCPQVVTPPMGDCLPVRIDLSQWPQDQIRRCLRRLYKKDIPKRFLQRFNPKHAYEQAFNRQAEKK